MDLAATLSALAVALTVEDKLGYPPALLARIGHPVIWMGRLIQALEQRFNDPADTPDGRRVAGVLGLLLLLVVTGFVSGLAEIAALMVPLGPILVGVLASSLVAAASLDRHVAAVANAFGRSEWEGGGLEGAREAVSHIVGRNTAVLDEAGVCRAAIESLAENFSDGTVAPGLWFALGGLPGMALYKAVNTADSMVGHRTPRHEHYGWASARLDDLVNLPASRLAALLLVAAAALRPDASARGAWTAVRRDASRHRSPNAGWPEAAMAGALGLRLAGPRQYGTVLVDDAPMGDGRAEATPDDIHRALALYRAAGLVGLGLVGVLLGAAMVWRAQAA